MFKLVSRAAQFIIRHIWDGYERWDLAKTPDEWRKTMGVLQHNARGFHCYDCGKEMRVPDVFVGDAGQAYEALDLNFVSSTFQALFTAYGNTAAPSTVTVHCTQHCSGQLGGRADMPSDSQVVFRVAEIQRALVAMLCMRIYRVGNAWLRQVSGMPIGGPGSKVMLSASLGRLEAWFDQYI
jgi:hypothetical protein